MIFGSLFHSSNYLPIYPVSTYIHSIYIYPVSTYIPSFYPSTQYLPISFYNRNISHFYMCLVRPCVVVLACESHPRHPQRCVTWSRFRYCSQVVLAVSVIRCWSGSGRPVRGRKDKSKERYVRGKIRGRKDTWQERFMGGNIRGRKNT